MKAEDLGVHSIKQLESFKEAARYEVNTDIDQKIELLKSEISGLEKEKTFKMQVLKEMPEIEKELAGRNWQYAILLGRPEDEIDYPINPLCFRALVFRIPEGVKFNGFNLSECHHMDNVDLVEETRSYWHIEPKPKDAGGMGSWRQTDRTKEQALKQIIEAAKKLQEKYPTAKVYDMLEDWQYTNENTKAPEETDVWIRENRVGRKY